MCRQQHINRQQTLFFLQGPGTGAFAGGHTDQALADLQSKLASLQLAVQSTQPGTKLHQVRSTTLQSGLALGSFWSLWRYVVLILLQSLSQSVISKRRCCYSACWSLDHSRMANHEQKLHE